MTAERKSLAEKILTINPKIIMIILLILLIIPLAKPLALPLAISKNTKHFYEIIDGFKPGAKVLFNYIPTTATMGDLCPPSVPVIYHLYTKHVKIYFVGVGVADGILTLIDTQVFSTIPPEKFGYKYGEDWCNLGFLAGGDITWATFAKDIRAAVKFDRYGNPIDSLPMMKEINSIKDFDYVIHCGESITILVRQWGDPYKIPLLVISTTAAVPMDVIPFYRTGQIYEYLGGLGAGAEYEKLVNRPGKAIASVDAITLTHIFLIGIIILGNIVYSSTRLRGGKIR